MVTIRKCARAGCRATVRAEERGRPRRYCSDKCRVDVAQGRAEARSEADCVAVPLRDPFNDQSGFSMPKPKASGESWWLNGSTFYAEARKRYPETGAAYVDRGKVALHAADDPTLGARMARLRERSA